MLVTLASFTSCAANLHRLCVVYIPSFQHTFLQIRLIIISFWKREKIIWILRRVFINLWLIEVQLNCLTQHWCKIQIVSLFANNKHWNEQKQTIASLKRGPRLDVFFSLSFGWHLLPSTTWYCLCIHVNFILSVGAAQHNGRNIFVCFFPFRLNFWCDANARKHRNMWNVNEYTLAQN